MCVTELVEGGGDVCVTELVEGGMCVSELKVCLHAVHDELINLGRNYFTTPHLASTPVRFFGVRQHLSILWGSSTPFRFFGVRQHLFDSLGFVNTCTILWGSSTPFRFFGVRQHLFDSLGFVNTCTVLCGLSTPVRFFGVSLEVTLCG